MYFFRAKNKPQLCKHLYVHTAEYIAKRANSYPEGTKLLIGDAVDQMKRDLKHPLKEVFYEQDAKKLKKVQEVHVENGEVVMNNSKPENQKQVEGNLMKFNSMPSPGPSTIAPPSFSALFNGNSTEEKMMFSCDRCPYTHHRRDAVQSHQKRHEQFRNSRDGKQCSYCDYTCLQPSYLRDHITWHFDPPQDRKAIAFTNFNQIEIWKTLIIVNQENQKVQSSNKELLFKDLGKDYNVVERFKPFEQDDQLFEMLDNEDIDDDDDDEEEHEAQENEAAQALLQMQFNVSSSEQSEKTAEDASGLVTA